jgi:hypothetical protein
MHPGPIESYISYLNVAASAALIARLCFQRLAGIYRLLFLYLVLDTLQGILTLVFSGNNRLILWIYEAGQTLKLIAAIFVAMELFRLALVQQPALARFGRSIIGYILAASGALAALNALVRVPPRGLGYQVARFLSFERATHSMIMLILILMSVFLLWFPVRTRRNTAVCIAGFVVYSFQRWAGLLLGDLWPAYQRQFSTAMLCISLACLIAWIILLRRAGETSTVQTGHHWNRAEADRLGLQLNAINAKLGGS